MTDIGHNKEIKSFIERIERLEDEKKNAQDAIKDVYAEAKSRGLESGIIKKLVRLRKISEQKRKEEAELLSLYASAIQFDLGF